MDDRSEIVFKQVQALLHQQFQLPESTILWESDLVEDLGLNLLQFAEFSLLLEQEFDRKLSGSNAFNLTTVGQLVNYMILYGNTSTTQ